MYYYFKDHPLFGENLVDWFITQCLDEFIPDVLIDVLKTRRMVCIALDSCFRDIGSLYTCME